MCWIQRPLVFRLQVERSGQGLNSGDFTWRREGAVETGTTCVLYVVGVSADRHAGHSYVTAV